MLMTEPIQVELVSAWWESLLPLAAFVISLLSVGLTLWFRFSDRVRLEVSLSAAIPILDPPLPQEGIERTVVTVTNRSRSASTEITALELELSDGSSFVRFDPGPGDVVLPKRLDAGASCRVSYDSRSLGLALNGDKKHVKWVRGHAVSGHKTAHGKRSVKRAQQLRNYAVEYPDNPWGERRRP
ncbi:hypothetical protein NCCP1664_17820 [Zafaria cholistanensis]|uniref:Uncharacterized protein n=1 Tax=Zafaria cholistanensis TaxID=1682741 RepID=A0A5A7NRU0_9MICC|nr:hypothetical protein NCCP1664_17820 [Zafaria cholistanensis]